MKKIVIVTNNYANGGTERRAMVLANGFVEKGYVVTYLVLNKVYDDVVYRVDDRIKLVSIEEFKLSDSKLTRKVDGWAKRNYFFLNKRYRIAQLFRIHNPKLIRKRNCITHINSLRAFMLLNSEATYIAFGISIFEKLSYASSGLDAKLLFTDINSTQAFLSDKEKDLLNNVQCKLLSKAKICIFQTYNQKSYYEKYVKNLKWRVIRNPISSVLPEAFIGKREKIIVNFCRTHPQKNLELLVDAFYKLSREYPDYKLIVYGATSTPTAENYKQQLQKKIANLDLIDKAFVFDAVSDVHERIKNYSMFVSSSDYEGLSNSMLEAMAMGLPCICTDCLGGGARELIQNGVNGLLVPSKDVDALNKAMKEFIEKPKLAEKCGKNAAEIRNQLSADRIINQWIEVLENI